MENKINQALSQYPVFTLKDIKHNIVTLFDTTLDDYRKKDIYTDILSFIDLTSLHTDDSQDIINNMVIKVNDFNEHFPNLKNVAAICVYPIFVKSVKDLLTEDVNIAAVAGGFPHAQTFEEIKIAETSLCVLDGANEIDIVFPVGLLKDKKYEEIIENIQEIKNACNGRTLKVILESGILSIDELRIASILAIEAGADFIKTSTGKEDPAATTIAAWVMCSIIDTYNKITGKEVGFKAAGGISTCDEALQYYTIVKHILGDKWLSKDLFRIGASKLANNMLSVITDKDIKYF